MYLKNLSNYSTRGRYKANVCIHSAMNRGCEAETPDNELGFTQWRKVANPANVVIPSENHKLFVLNCYRVNEIRLHLWESLGRSAQHCLQLLGPKQDLKLAEIFSVCHYCVFNSDELGK